MTKWPVTSTGRTKASFGLNLLGFVLSILVFLVLGSVVVMPLSAIKPDYAESPSFSLVGTLLSFNVVFVAIPLIVALLDQRPYWSVAVPVPRVECWNPFTGFRVKAIVGVVVAVALLDWPARNCRIVANADFC